MSNQVVIDVLPLATQHFPKSIVVPSFGQSVQEISEGTMMQIMENTEVLWGSDSLGGMAYFGTNEDMAKVKEQASIYLSKIPHACDQFYLMWEMKDYSLLALYEDYQNHVDNPYPAQDNVLFVHFGAWTDDEPLLSVLKHKSYIEDWRYGHTEFDRKDTIQKNLINEMKKAIKLIDKSQK